MWGSLISAGASLLGGLFGKGPSIGKQVHSQNAAKMEDAAKYGISKLAMLGAPVSISAPQNVMGPALADMGQNIGRAVDSKITSGDRALKQLLLQKAALDNDLVRAQIRAMNAETLTKTAAPAPPVRLSPEGLPAQEVIAPQRTSHLVDPTGKPMPTGPGSDAQTAEGRYGEVGGEIQGMENLVYDTLKRHFPGYKPSGDIIGDLASVLRPGMLVELPAVRQYLEAHRGNFDLFLDRSKVFRSKRR